MANYANAQFHSFVKDTDIKQQILLANPVPENLNKAKKIDEVVKDIQKENINKKIWIRIQRSKEPDPKTSISWDHCQNSSYLHKMLFHRRRKKCQ